MADNHAPAAWHGEAALPFQVPSLDLRGRLVRLGPSLDAMLERHNYPPAVAELLAEAMMLAATLATSIKYDGIFTLQIRGDGPVRLLVTDVTSTGQMRGYAQFDAVRLQAALNHSAPDISPVPRLLGAGTLAFTVDQGPDTERYQGVVSLEGATLAECAQAYFRQSEQLKTGLRLAVARNANGDGTADQRAHWRGAALMIQRLPGELTVDGFSDDSDEADDRWRRAVILLSTTTDKEMLDGSLRGETLLYRLYHEEGVHASPPRHLQFGCRCSRQRIENVLRSFPKDEIADLKDERGEIVVTCEFCLTQYRFDDQQVEALWAEKDKS
jgi:molecular chaperone Hsp33